MKFPLKLVRDKVPVKIEAKGGTAVVRQLTPDQYIWALRHRLVEAACEVRSAKSRKDLATGLAEVLDVAETIRMLGSVPLGDVEFIRQSKKLVDGGYNEGKFLVFSHGDKG